ncbi:MAG: DUF1134 domain-containing protein [Alphaproteobacteria bacterium]
MTRFPSLKKIGIASLCLLWLAGCATNAANPYGTEKTGYPQADQPYAEEGQSGGLSENELVQGISTHLGVTSESAASIIARLFKDRGRPSGYITGDEGSGAIGVGARYGKGTLWLENGQSVPVYWQGPTVGFDFGGDASKVFTLVYGLDDPQRIYQRFPGVDGSAYLVGGMAVNYQRANGITLAPIRSGVGVRLGAKVGYTSYTTKRNYLPF